MKCIDRDRLKENEARKKMRGNVSAKMGDIFTSKDYEVLKKRANNTPNLDKLFSIDPVKHT